MLLDRRMVACAFVFTARRVRGLSAAGAGRRVARWRPQRSLKTRSAAVDNNAPVTTELATDLATKYDFGAFEEELYKWWQAEGYFKPADEAVPPHPRGAFTVPMPPPNVTGRLHLGHAMFVALQDILTRFHRMRGRPTLWLPGTDHAGIATQLLVERELAAEGATTRVELGREKFLKRVYAYKERNGGAIMSQMRRLGASADWSREKFTLEDSLSEAVVEAFVRLHESGKVYRGSRMVNWSPSLGTAVSDLEVETVDRVGKLYYFKYPIADSDETVTVATTRPETILGDAGLCVHPEDERYRHLVGRSAVVPMVGRRIPIVADAYVDRDFGSGVLKVTPGHDHNDYAIGKRHDLPVINIMNPDATINGEGGTKYEGLERFKCRKVLWADMEAAGLTVRVDEAHAQRIPISQRGGEVIEPLVSEQWFVKTDEMCRRSVDAVRSGQIRIVPARFEKDWYNWLEEPQDWCVSRQLWWGHQIPVWYVRDHDDKTYYVVARNETEARKKASADLGREVPQAALFRDPDVLDTWFSSGLWPFATVGWPDEASPDFSRFYPATLLETGYDILFFWVARMVMMGLEFTDKPPFDVIYMHGLVRDEKGQKMSKTKGNVIDPIDVVDKYGADALRFSLVTGVTPGQDVPLSMDRVEQNRNFANKLWNVARFVDSKGKNLAATPAATSFPMGRVELDRLPLPERWIVSEAHATVSRVSEALEDYAVGEAGRRIYEFVWDEFADWYVELSKARPEGSSDAKVASDRVLRYVLDVSCRLLHPFMPHVTEFLWRKIFATGDNPALIVADWPQLEAADTVPVDGPALADFEAVKNVVRAIRNIRAEYDIVPKVKIGATIVAADARLAASFEEEVAVVAFLAKCDPAKVAVATAVTAAVEADSVRLIVADGLDVYVPAAYLQKDAKKEVDRLSKQNAKLAKDIAGLEGRLNAPGFADKAPATVVDAAKATLADKLQQQKVILDSIAEYEKAAENQNKRSPQAAN